MEFSRFWRSLEPAQKKAFCQRAGVPESHMRSHIVTKQKYQTMPHRPRLLRLWQATDGDCTLAEVVEHFIGPLDRTTPTPEQQRIIDGDRK